MEYHSVLCFLVYQLHYVTVILHETRLFHGSSYLGHLTPKSGSAHDISVSILELLQKKNLEDNVFSIGCDGTRVNTGAKGGVIALLEQSLCKPLQWNICLLHGNELPLRHLITNIDGPTMGPRSFSGPIGKLLPNCEKMTLASYEPIISENIPKGDYMNDLSCDQKYLLNIFEAVKSGHCDDDLSYKAPGNISCKVANYCKPYFETLCLNSSAI